ncbi:TPA: hypothetical protein ACPJ0J_003627 [Vibrio alginolyticus]
MSLIHGYRRQQTLVLVTIIAALQAASACILFVITAKIAEQFAFSLSDNVRLLPQGCAVFIILLALKVGVSNAIPMFLHTSLTTKPNA